MVLYIARVGTGQAGELEREAALAARLRRDDPEAFRQLASSIESRCMACEKELGKRDVRVLPPKYFQDRDSYVRNGFVARRIMCIACFNSLKNGTRVRERVRERDTTKSKSMVRSLMLRHFFG